MADTFLLGSQSQSPNDKEVPLQERIELSSKSNPAGNVGNNQYMKLKDSTNGHHQNYSSATMEEDVASYNLFQVTAGIDEGTETEQVYVRKGTIWSSSVNLSNSNIGIGTIGLAYGIKESGWFLGILLFVLCHFLNHITMYMMMEVARQCKVASYAIVCNKCQVPVLQIVSDYSMVINKLLSCSSYCILIGDYMALVVPQIVGSHEDASIYHNRRFWISVFIILFIIPTNVVRKIDALKYTSFFALVCFFYLTIMVQYFAYIEPPSQAPNPVNISVWPQPESPLSFFKTISLFIYAYGGHPIAFGITTELVNPTMKRLNWIIWNFCTFSTFIFASVAFGGYLTYGEETKGNLLNTYPDDANAVIVVRVALCFAVAFSFPLLGNVIKNSLGSIIYGVGVKNDQYSWYALIFGKDEFVQKDLEEKDVTMIPASFYYPLVVIVVAIPFTLSMITNKLSVIFQFNGATVGTFNQVIFPALMYYFACRNGVIQPANKDAIHWKKWAAVFILIMGFSLIPFMVYYAIDTLLRDDSQ